MTGLYCELVNSAYNHEHSDYTLYSLDHSAPGCRGVSSHLYSFQLYSLEIMDPLSIEIPQTSGGDTEG